jgi:hypothetical protein
LQQVLTLQRVALHCNMLRRLRRRSADSKVDALVYTEGKRLRKDAEKRMQSQPQARRAAAATALDAELQQHRTATTWWATHSWAAALARLKRDAKARAETEAAARAAAAAAAAATAEIANAARRNAAAVAKAQPQPPIGPAVVMHPVLQSYSTHPRSSGVPLRLHAGAYVQPAHKPSLAAGASAAGANDAKARADADLEAVTAELAAADALASSPRPSATLGLVGMGGVAFSAQQPSRLPERRPGVTSAVRVSPAAVCCAPCSATAALTGTRERIGLARMPSLW